MLSLCHLPRSVLNSWSRAGLDLKTSEGAYGLREVIAVLLLGAARDHIQPKEMAPAWQEIVDSGADIEIVQKARRLSQGDRFDFVIDPENASFAIAQSDAELAAVVRFSSWPRPIVVVDVAERIRQAVRTFDKVGNATPRPKERSSGRPRSAARIYRLSAEGS